MSGERGTCLVRNLIIVLGDQLAADAAAFDGFDAGCDGVWMAEVAAESEHVWSSKPRTALFLAAMRHFRDAQRALGRQVRYTTLDDALNTGTLADELAPDRLRRLGFFDAEAVDRLRREHAEHRQNHEGVLWALLCFSTWHRGWVETAPPSAETFFPTRP